MNISDKNLLQSVAECCREMKMCLQHLQVNNINAFSRFVAEVAEKNGKKVKVFSFLTYTILLLYYYYYWQLSIPVGTATAVMMKCPNCIATYTIARAHALCYSASSLAYTSLTSA
jgi:hypothetical protein